MDLDKWLKIKRSGSFKRKIKKAHQYYKKETIRSVCLTSSVEPSRADDEREDYSENHNTDDKSADEESSDSNESEISVENYNNEEFQMDFKRWVIHFNITHEATRALSVILNKRLPFILPRDPRTFLNTDNEKISLHQVDKGYYWHNGIIEPLTKYLKHISVLPETIFLNVNVDGLPVYKSSREQVWPILCNIYEKPEIPPFVIGIYSGQSKPNDLEAYFSCFVGEMNEILENGIKIITEAGLEIIKNISIRAFVCDSPARALIKGVCNFNGKHGCLKCTVVGEYSQKSHTVVFLKTDCPKRTDEDFRAKRYGSHHKYDSPLLRLPIDMIEHFPVGDSLHLIDLGIMKRLLTGWRDGNFGKYLTKWCARETERVSQFLKACKLSSEIHRSVRGLDILAHWKASEFRTFLLYISCIVLKDSLPSQAYHHFMCLYCAITILSNEKHFVFLRLTEEFLKYFVENYGQFYGQEHITSNVHNLTHLVDEVKRFGKLQDFNAYPFENKLYSIKRMVRHGNKPLQQIARRLKEKESIDMDVISENENINYPYVQKRKNKLSNILHLQNYSLSLQENNKWFLSNNDQVVEVLSIDNVDGIIHIKGNYIRNVTDAFEKPMRSSFLKIYMCNAGENFKVESNYFVTDIQRKLVSLIYDSKMFFVPLSHSL